MTFFYLIISPLLSLLLLFSFPLNSLSSSLTITTYDHCSSIIPELTRDTVHSAGFSVTSPARNHGYYFREPGALGSRPVLDPSNLARFHLLGVNETDVQDLFSVQAMLSLSTIRTNVYRRRKRRNRYSDSVYQFQTTEANASTRIYLFTLHGFWSMSHGKVCVVGESEISPRGESNDIPVLLKLNHLYNSTNITNLVTGTLESLVVSDQSVSDHFDRISVVMFSSLNYEYKLFLEEFGRENSDDTADVSPSLPLELLSTSICTLLPFMHWALRYSRHCRSTLGSAENCSPLRGNPGHLPSLMMLRHFECSKDQQGLRVLIKFPISTGNYSIWDDNTLDHNTTLVGEGVWDSKRNRLFVVACRFLKSTEAWSEARLGDCSTRLSWRFPAVWTIGNTKRIVGQVWSAKNATELGYFEKIGFQYSDEQMEGSLGMRYKYTKIEEAKKWCPREVPAKNNAPRKKYPDAFSKDMSFDIVCLGPRSGTGRGYVQPISVEDRFYKMQWDQNMNPSGSALLNPEHPKDSSYVKMSYRIVMVNVSSESSGWFDVSAEGVYDVTTGRLCMVGCRNTLLNDDDNLDCDILVNFQFPTINDSDENGGFITGSIESKRKRSDPRYFQALKLSSAAYVSAKAKENIWEVDLEITLGLVSNTLACVFTAFQIFHSRKNPDSLPCVSLSMLLALTFAYTTRFAMALKAMLMPSFQSRDVLLGAQGWLEAEGLSEGVMALLLLLLLARLVQHTWSARLSHQNRRALSIVEKQDFLVSLPLYFGGAVLSASFAWSKRSKENSTVLLALIASYNENPAWSALVTYSNLLLNFFLVPQVMLNVLRDSREKCLSCFFYVGMTLVNLLPHAYGLYKDQNSALKVALVSFGSLIFTVIIYLQQKFRGRCVLPSSLRESNMGNKVTDDVAEAEI